MSNAPPENRSIEVPCEGRPPRGVRPRRSLPVSVSTAVATAITLLVYSIHHQIEISLRSTLASALAFGVAISTVRLSQRWSFRSAFGRQVDAYLLCIALTAILRMIFDFTILEMLPALLLAGWLFHRMLDAAWFDDLDHMVKTKKAEEGDPFEP